MAQTDRKYSLYRLYGKRWVRVSNDALPIKEARKKWGGKVSQSSFFTDQIYNIRLLPKENRKC